MPGQFRDAIFQTFLSRLSEGHNFDLYIVKLCSQAIEDKPENINPPEINGCEDQCWLRLLNCFYLKEKPAKWLGSQIRTCSGAAWQ